MLADLSFADPTGANVGKCVGASVPECGLDYMSVFSVYPRCHTGSHLAEVCEQKWSYACDCCGAHHKPRSPQQLATEREAWGCAVHPSV